MRPPRYPWEPWQEEYVLKEGGLQPWKIIARVVGKTPLAVRLKYCRKHKNENDDQVPRETATA